MIRASTLAMTALMLLVAAAPIAAEPGADLERARDLVEAQRYALARSYLDPLVIHPGLSPAERAQAYYLRGVSFEAEDFPVSAAQDYIRGLEYHAATPAALTALSNLYARGRGVPYDPGKAMRLARQAAALGHAPAAFYVGYAYLTGTGTKRDTAEARRWLAEAADAGIPGALAQLARSYRAPYAAAPEPDRAAELYYRAAARGADEALVALAFMHRHEELETASPERAMIYLALAAQHDHAPALDLLAGLYMEWADEAGDRTAAYETAAELCDRAAELGNGPAFARCAYLHGSDALGEPDPQRARAYLRGGAERGHVFSQLALANLLLGDGTADAITEAQHWLRRAAQAGNTQARNNLAWTLATSEHDELRDGDEAFRNASAAIARDPGPGHLDTLAAAHAELGEFEAAIAVQLDALAALDGNDEHLEEEFEQRLLFYRQRQAWRE